MLSASIIRPMFPASWRRASPGANLCGIPSCSSPSIRLAASPLRPARGALRSVAAAPITRRSPESKPSGSKAGSLRSRTIERLARLSAVSRFWIGVGKLPLLRMASFPSGRVKSPSAYFARKTLDTASSRRASGSFPFSIAATSASTGMESPLSIGSLSRAAAASDFHSERIMPSNAPASCKKENAFRAARRLWTLPPPTEIDPR